MLGLTKTIKKGFTLVELLIVMTIIGVLIIIGVNAAQYNIAYSNDQAHKQYIVQVSQVLSNYYAEHNAYPHVLCPAVTGGFDRGGNLQTDVYNTIPNTDSVYSDFTTIMNKITAAGLVPSIGYCSASTSDSAYILFLKTTTKQNCADGNNPANSYYIVGDGTYTLALNYRNYYNIPADYGLAAINTASYSSSCFTK